MLRWPVTCTPRPRLVAAWHMRRIRRTPLALRTRFHSSEQIFSSAASAPRAIRRPSPIPDLEFATLFVHIVGRPDRRLKSARNTIARVVPRSCGLVFSFGGSLMMGKKRKIEKEKKRKGREENRFFEASHRAPSACPGDAPSPLDNNTDARPIIVIISLHPGIAAFIFAAQRFIAFARIDATPQLG